MPEEIGPTRPPLTSADPDARGHYGLEALSKEQAGRLSSSVSRRRRRPAAAQP